MLRSWFGTTRQEHVFLSTLKGGGRRRLPQASGDRRAIKKILSALGGLTFAMVEVTSLVRVLVTQMRCSTAMPENGTFDGYVTSFCRLQLQALPNCCVRK